MTDNEFFGTARISRILMKLTPPVMLAQLIQALYNIVDSFFIGRCSEAGLTALSIIYPLQLLMIALAVGTGVGINTAMAYFLGIHDRKRADEIAGASTPLALGMWALFAAVTCLMMPAYARMSTPSEEVIRQVVTYGRITCVCSIGLFLESGWTKVLQAEGNMNRPMVAQIIGAITNIVLDPLLIFVFDMGEGVKFAELARRMIALAGVRVDQDIRIVYTGLRPGEKLYEEVLSNTENTLPTAHEKIRIAKVREYDYEEACRDVEELERLAREFDIPNVVRLMKRIVPEYHSQNSRFEVYDRELEEERTA